MKGPVKAGYVPFFSNSCCCTSFPQDPPTTWHCDSESVAYVCRIEGLVSILDVSGSAFCSTKWHQDAPGITRKYRIFESDDINSIEIYCVFCFLYLEDFVCLVHWLAMV